MWIWMILIASVSTGTILSCPQNCEECWTSDGQNRCSNGHYLDGHQWIRCPRECELCTGSHRCPNCTERYYLDGNRCEHCPPGCATCSGPDRCANCTEGYYQDGSRCTQCPPGCETCTGSDRCANCTEGYYPDEHRCEHCPTGCETCIGPDRCTSCKEGYYQDIHRCKQCPPRCETCTGSDRCTRCTEGYYYQDGNRYFGNHCQPCRNCKDNVCSHDGQCAHGCKVGSYVSTIGCATCPKECINCTSPTACTACNRGYYGNRCVQPCRNCKNNTCLIDGQCTGGCIDRHYQITIGCAACPNVCLACRSPAACTSCSLGYYGNKCKQKCRNCENNKCLIGGRCTDGCIDRHFQGNSGCDPCPDNCSKCVSGSRCNRCYPGFHGSTCRQRCPQNCSTCTSDSNCSKCKDGYFGQSCRNVCPIVCRDGCNKANGECFSCIDGYYKEGGRCKVCSNGCARCVNAYTCIACHSGYFREINHHKCIACGVNCSVCKTNDSCITCNERYTTVNGRCLPCHNCKDFKTCSSQSACPKCLDGFWGQYCMNVCNDTCTRCDKSTGQCTQCSDNTFGRYCELQCSRNCLQLSDINPTCWQHNGTCTDGCVQGFTGQKCTEEVPPQISTNVVLIVGPILGGIVVMVAVVIVGTILRRKRGNQFDIKKARRGHPSGRRDPRTSTFNPAYEYIDIDPAAEAWHQTAPVGENEASANYVNVLIHTITPRKLGQANKARGQDEMSSNVYSFASEVLSHGGAASTDTSRSKAKKDTYSHINHTCGARLDLYDNEDTYDHVTQ